MKHSNKSGIILLTLSFIFAVVSINILFIVVERFESYFLFMFLLTAYPLYLFIRAPQWEDRKLWKRIIIALVIYVAVFYAASFVFDSCKYNECIVHIESSTALPDGGIFVD